MPERLRIAPTSCPGSADCRTVRCCVSPTRLRGWPELEPTQARVLLFAFEEAGLVRRGPDCTLEATVLLNRTPDEIVATLYGPGRAVAGSSAVPALGAAADRQVTYRADRRARRAPASIPLRSTRS